MASKIPASLTNTSNHTNRILEKEESLEKEISVKREKLRNKYVTFALENSFKVY